MPDRFQGRRLPAIMYAQPFEFAVAGILVLAGGAMMIDPGVTPSSIDQMTWPWTWVFRGMSVTAGALITWGLFRGKHRWGFGLEITGFILAGTVFTTYCAGLAESSDNPRALLAGITNFLVAAACYWKAYTLIIESRARLVLIRQVPHIRPTTGD